MNRGERRYINLPDNPSGLLLSVEKSCRYAGGEYGRLADKNAPFQTLIAFPDLYEIGMCNQALKILYNRLNGIPGVSCDRAFAPAPDFERLLRETKLPLYGLDTGISLKDLDALLFTLGYELCAGGMLTMMDVSGIPVHASQRGETDPIVIAGGPAISNPLPYSPFIDAFWIGEAEAGFFELAAELAALKQNGKSRAELLAHIAACPHMWVRGKEKTLRAVDSDFGRTDARAAVFPVPSMKIVHHHGALEIMRGCPNGCRFCHAGYWYRPMRQKNHELVIKEADEFIAKGGYREISLSSLSSGDYQGIAELVAELNRIYSGRRVSFQLPSLKVSGFSLSILEQISQTRKSGLTFAIETPQDAWQLSLNKDVARDSVVEILKEAKKHGWRAAKFYFMIGLPLELPELPVGAEGSEEKEIVDFILDVARRTAMNFNINAGVFIPKPHTPYQWAAQIGAESAFEKLMFIKSALKKRGHRVSISDTLSSVIEGLLSRGDERVGRLIEEAYCSGSTLDAWSEYINKDAWKNILENNRELVASVLAAKCPSARLPWQGIDSGVTQNYLRDELEKSRRHEITRPCKTGCANPCGVCGRAGDSLSDSIGGSLGAIFYAAKSRNTGMENHAFQENAAKRAAGADPGVWRLLLSFKKQGSAVFHGHLGLLEIFSMAINRAGLAVLYTQGFNPLVKMEVASPLATGISGLAEIASLDFAEKPVIADFIERLNAALPADLSVTSADFFYIPGGSKKHSLASLLWGFCYSGSNGETFVPAGQEKQYRTLSATTFQLTRNSVLAKNIINQQNSAGTDSPSGAISEWASYFDVYRHLYPAV